MSESVWLKINGKVKPLNWPARQAVYAIGGVVFLAVGALCLFLLPIIALVQIGKTFLEPEDERQDDFY
jgi:hypothetical protein